jgi:hypothetical protein
MQTNSSRLTSPPLSHNIDEPVEPITGLPGAIVLFSDIACPWATVTVLRLRAARVQLGLADNLPIIHLAHPLELIYSLPLTRRVIEAATPAWTPACRARL